MGTLTDLEATTMRKERSQKAFVVNTIAARQQGDNHTSSKLSTRSSTHPVFSSFWGLGIVDIHEKITHKKLHNNSLGVTRTVLRVIELYLGKVFSKKRATEITKELNLRLGSMDRYYDLQLPLSLKKGYFFEACHVQGHEHANVSKLLPHLLIGLTSVARGVDLPMDLAIAWRLHQMTLAGDKRPLDYVGSQQQATDLRASNAHLLQCFLAFEFTPKSTLVCRMTCTHRRMMKRSQPQTVFLLPPGVLSSCICASACSAGHPWSWPREALLST
eukprot:scaffold190319_cov18-Tisochrysis_lutea.AAC.1